MSTSELLIVLSDKLSMQKNLLILFSDRLSIQTCKLLILFSYICQFKHEDYQLYFQTRNHVIKESKTSDFLSSKQVTFLSSKQVFKNGQVITLVYQAGVFLPQPMPPETIPSNV
jgi:hypothetical protein